MTTPVTENRLRDALSYDEYRSYWHEQKETSPEGKDPDDRRRIHYLNYNWERQARVHENYTPSDELREALSAIDEAQDWMVLTEPWCGDSAFLLPVIAEAAEFCERVTLRILLRDDNLDVMDEYLTDGSRSIPKLVAFSGDGDELWTWGPRPEGARRRFATLQDEYEDKRTVVKKLVSYYEDGGWREAEDELLDRIQTAVPERTP